MVARLGIDFGTTRTVVAAADAGRYPVCTFDTGLDYRDHVPGVALLRGSERAYGWEALRSAGEGTLVRSIKRAVQGLAPDDEVPGTGVTALDLVTGFLAHLRRVLIQDGSLELREDQRLEAMVAVPANASTRQRYLTLEGFRRAGFEPLGLLNEPTAAAVELTHRHLRGLAPGSPKRYAVVYDLGGGTFDAAAVSLQGKRFELLAADGVARLGGDDIDEEILALALSEAGIDGSTLDAARRAASLEVCRAAKEGLRPNSRRVLVDLAEAVPGAPEVVLEVAGVYSRCEPLVEATLAPLARVFAALRDRGIDPANPRELGAVYLVGGSVAFPPVARALRPLYKRKLRMAAEPHAATAVGLAVAADPDAGVLVRESSTRHFGVWREGEHGREKTFDLLIGKDRAPAGDGPLRVERVYRPAHAVGHLRFLECSGLDAQGQPVGDLTPWSEIRFPYDPRLADLADLDALSVERSPELSNEEIVETYLYGADGRVTVDIENRTRGYRRSYALGGLG